MSPQLIQVLALLGAAIVMFALNKPRMDAVALLVLTFLPFTGAVSMNEALAGFSDPNVVLIAALFVIGDGLVRTGVAQRLGDWLATKSGNSDALLLVLLMVVVAGLGSMMSSTAVTAIFIPVALRIAHSTGAAPSRLMMPLSFAALISGMLTLVATTPNLVVNSELIRQGHSGFRFFSFTPFGIPVLILGIVYMGFARNWLPAGTDAAASRCGRPRLADWVAEYNLAHREFRLRLGEGTPLVGKTLEEAHLRESAGLNILAIERQRGKSLEVRQPSAKMELLAGDVLLVDRFDPSTDIAEAQAKFGLEALPLTGAFFDDHSQEIGLAEAIVPDVSDLVGKTVAESSFRARTGLTVIGMRRGRTALEQVQGEPIHVGDTLLVAGRWKQIRRLGPEAGAMLLRVPTEMDEVPTVLRRAPHAVACLFVVVALMISGLVPNVQAALIGCLLMGLLGCVNLTSAYRAINWKSIVLIVGMLPFSIALERTGGVEMMANGVMQIVGESNPRVLLACVFAITATLGLFISNTATAVLMAPVALAIARDLGVSPYPFAMIVALAASTAFMTPVSSPVNTLVVAPGNYRFGDFVRVGTPFSVVVLVVSVILVPWLLPL